jgi:hypothetical protein
MSIRMIIAVVAGLGAAVGLVGGAGAEMAAPTKSKAAKPKTVTVAGCATKGVPDFCTMMKGPKGANYNVSGASPAAPVGKRIRLQGTVSDKMSPCGGTVLDGVKWAEVRGKC